MVYRHEPQEFRCKHCDKYTKIRDEWNIEHRVCHSCYFTELERIYEDNTGKEPAKEPKLVKKIKGLFQ